MHDPSTVAHEIRYPWRAFPRRVARSEFERSYRREFITIWHEDPQRDGSDDSCGYSYPRLTKRQMERLKSLAWSEGRDPYFLRCQQKHWNGTRAEAEALYRGLVLAVADMLDMALSFDSAARMAAIRIHRPDCVDAADVFCFLPGWHTNGTSDTPDKREDVFLGTAIGIARELLRAQRRWYQHPRWHVWHWRVQIHPTQEFKRWAFSRCAACGQRFKYGESPVSHQWDGGGPRWFRGERGVYHMACSHAPSPSGEAQSERVTTN